MTGERKSPVPLSVHPPREFPARTCCTGAARRGGRHSARIAGCYELGSYRVFAFYPPSLEDRSVTARGRTETFYGPAFRIRGIKSMRTNPFLDTWLFLIGSTDDHRALGPMRYFFV